MQKSETIGELAKALAKFQGTVNNPKKNGNNPHFNSKFSTLDEIINTIRPTLSEHGLSFLQSTKTESDLVGVSTMILHTSGEFISSDFIWVPTGKNNAHGVGAATTYGRRFSSGSMLGIATDEDTDGNELDNQQVKNQQQKTNQTTNNRHYEPKKISQNQLKMLNALITRMDNEKGIPRELTIETLRAKPGIGQFDSTANLSVGQASKAIETLQTALGDK